MAKYVCLNAFISYDGTDRSNQFSKVEIMTEREEKDVSVFGDRSVRILPGIFKNSIALHVKPDTDMVFLNEVLQDYNADVPIAVVVRLKNAAAAANNLQFTGNAVISKPLPMGATKGDVMEGDVTWPIDGPWSENDGTTTTTIG